jgi:sec-independent protein translocase protein TatB
MFGLGASEILIILVVALIIIGPKNLPKVARMLGKAMAQAQKMMSELQATIREEADEIKETSNLDEERATIVDAAPRVETATGVTSEPETPSVATLDGEDEEQYIEDNGYEAEPDGTKESEPVSVLHDKPSSASLEDAEKPTQDQDSEEPVNKEPGGNDS